MIPVKKKIAQKSAIAFFAVMVFFTLTSRTLSYYMTPKVIIDSPDSGYIKNTYTLNEVNLFTDKAIDVNMAFKLVQPLEIFKLHVMEGNLVKKGDPIVTFDSYSYNEAVSVQEKLISKLKVELLEFDKKYSGRVSQIEKDMKDFDRKVEQLEKSIGNLCVNDRELVNIDGVIKNLESDRTIYIESLEQSEALYLVGAVPLENIRKLEIDKKNVDETILSEKLKYKKLQEQLIEQNKLELEDLLYKKKSISDDLRYLRNTGIMDGKTQEVILKEHKECEDLLNNLQMIEKNNFTLISPIDGQVFRIEVNEKEKYSGISSIVKIIPDTAEVNFVAYLPTELKDAFNEGADCSISNGNTKIKGKVSKFMYIGDKKSIVIDVNEDKKISFENMDDLRNSKLHIDSSSTYCNIILPNSAFISESDVFILKSRKGFWGEEYYVSKVSVEIGDGNAAKTQVTNGISKGDKVVTGWDRVLNDGDRVVLPLK